MIAIIDYDIGNIAAVDNMFRRLGVESQITNDPHVITRADKIVLPGNGAFDACMINLRQSGLIPILEQRVLHSSVPLLGICVGAQILGNSSEEGGEPGLGWIDMTVNRLPVKADLRVPHMGWSRVSLEQLNHPLGRGVSDDARFYFVHSYYMKPMNPEDVFLGAHYGIDFAAGVAKGHIAGVQFHPEKSHRFGKQLFSAFAGIN
jgi:glutamine amidotransferase